MALTQSLRIVESLRSQVRASAHVFSREQSSANLKEKRHDFLENNSLPTPFRHICSLAKG